MTVEHTQWEKRRKVKKGWPNMLLLFEPNFVEQVTGFE